MQGLSSSIPLHWSVVDRHTRTIIIATLFALACAIGAAGPAIAAQPVPKVAIIVGPTDTSTEAYRGLANDAARAAVASGAAVVKVYSPDATWPAVKAAVSGASIVVYLGHGNGWPSRYRDALYPPTQDGFGLNPVAGGDDSVHQYFGEEAVGRLTMAPDAVVILSHLCYASGNSEPGLAEGTREQAIQRVDNYAAGFIRAGARAVVAEGHLGPAYYVRAILTGTLSIEKIWERSPSAHGNAFSVSSARSTGFTELLDPDQPGGGFYRSLVSAGRDVRGVRGSATETVATSPAPPPAQPDQASLDPASGTPAPGARLEASARTPTLPMPGGGLLRLAHPLVLAVDRDLIMPDGPPVPEPPVEPVAALEPSLAPVTPRAPERTPSPEAGSSPTPMPDPGVPAVGGGAADFGAAASGGRPFAPVIAPRLIAVPATGRGESATPRPSPSTDPAPSARPPRAPEIDLLQPEVDLVVPGPTGSTVAPAHATHGVRGPAHHDRLPGRARPPPLDDAPAQPRGRGP